MKTRREFLKAAGLGAGATALAFPETASAWGRRRRRCCESCGSPSPCDTCGSPGQEVRIFGNTKTGCTMACPIYCYAQANGIWYYRCYCCGVGGYCDAPSSYPLSTPTNCQSGVGCIVGTGHGGFPLTPKTTTGKPNPKAKFHMDTTAKTKDNNTIAIRHMQGLESLLRGDDLTSQLRSDPNLPAGTQSYISKVVTQNLCLQYNMSKRLIALYTISIVYTDPQSGDQIDNAAFPLRIGHEVQTLPTGCTAIPVDDPTPDSDFPHYVKYTYGDKDYHIVLGA